MLTPSPETIPVSYQGLSAKMWERSAKSIFGEIRKSELDAAVAAAYGFPTDLTDEAILERLLALNLAGKPTARLRREQTLG